MMRLSRAMAAVRDRPAEAVQANGIFISRVRATLLMVLAVVALALAFGGGVLLGYYLRSPPETSSPASQK